MAIVCVGVDLAKNVFAIHGVDDVGKAVWVQPPQVPHFARPNRSICGQARESNQRLAGSLRQKNRNPCSVTPSPGKGLQIDAELL